MSPQTALAAQGTPIITNLAAPYALVRDRRCRAGRRPGTKMAYLTHAITAGGDIRAYRGVGLGLDGLPQIEIPRRIDPADVLATFCLRPTRRALDRVRADLRRVDGAGVRS